MGLLQPRYPTGWQWSLTRWSQTSCYFSIPLPHLPPPSWFVSSGVLDEKPLTPKGWRYREEAEKKTLGFLPTLCVYATVGESWVSHQWRYYWISIENELEMPKHIGMMLATDWKRETWDSVPDFVGSFLCSSSWGGGRYPKSCERKILEPPCASGRLCSGHGGGGGIGWGEGSTSFLSSCNWKAKK